MPQIFQVLRCYKCSVFQVHQTKKSNKFVCKLCGEKQSIKRHYGIGTAKDCRLHVQKLNGIRKDIDELNNTISSSEEETVISSTEVIKQMPVKSKWSAFVEKTDIKDTEETMYLENKEVVLEVPKKKLKKKNVHNTDIVSDRANSSLLENICSSKTDSVEDISRQIDFLSQQSFGNCVPNTKIAGNCNNSKGSFSLQENTTNLDTMNVNLKCIVAEDRILAPKNDNMLVNQSSKWAQFIDNESIEKHLDSSYDLENSDYNDKKFQEIENTKTLFSLCEDNELDSILDI